MRVVTYLGKSDIRHILAEYFEVELGDVIIECYEDSVGYGEDEHVESTVRAMIEERKGELV